MGYSERVIRYQVDWWGLQGPKEADGPLSGSGRVTGTGIKGFMHAKAQ